MTFFGVFQSSNHASHLGIFSAATRLGAETDETCHTGLLHRMCIEKLSRSLKTFRTLRVETEMWMMKTWNRNVWVPFFFVGELPSFGVEYAYFSDHYGCC